MATAIDTYCTTEGDLTRKASPELEVRLARLEEWPLSLADAEDDPRCGCGEGTACAWDSRDTIEYILHKRDEAEGIS